MTDKLVERVARAIEGPHLPVPESSKFTLEHLRDVRWAQLSGQEQGERRSQARAAIAALESLTLPQTDLAVSRVECVSFESGYEDPSDPIWRIEVDGYCADFPSEAAATNFLRAITKALASSSVPEQDEWSASDVFPPDPVPVLAEYHEWNKPDGAVRQHVVWFFEDEWRPFPDTDGLAYVDRWKPLAPAVSAPQDRGASQEDGR